MNKRGPMPEKHKQEAIQRYLTELAVSGIRTQAVKASGVSWTTISAWKADGSITEADELDMQEINDDCIRYVAYQEGIEGLERVMRGNGHIILDDDGRPVIERVRNTRILLKFMEKLPEFASSNHKAANSTNIQINIGQTIPDKYDLHFDYRLLTREEIDTLRQIAAAQLERMQQVEHTQIIDSTLLQPPNISIDNQQ